MIKTLVLILTTFTATSAARLHVPFTPVSPAPVLGNNKCDLCKVFVAFAREHEDAICKDGDLVCRDFINDDLFCKIICDAEKKKWYDLL